MPSRHDPARSLADIIDNAERIAAYISGTSRSAFASDGKTRDAVECCLERVCEAAHRLGRRAAELMPTSHGTIFAVWETGCGTATIGSTLT